MQWFRAYHDMPNNPRLRRIAHAAGTSVSNVISTWMVMLCHASRQEGEARGTLTGWDDVECALTLGIDEALVFAIRREMEGRTLDNGQVIGWEEKQREGDSAAARMRAWREKKKSEKQEVNPPVTSPLRDGDATVRAEQNRTEKKIEISNDISCPKRAKRRASAYDPDFEVWFAAYPRHDAKGKAQAAWSKAVAELGEDGAMILCGALRRQLDAKHSTVCPPSGPQFIPMPATYLNGKRWLDGDSASVIPLFAGSAR